MGESSDDTGDRLLASSVKASTVMHAHVKRMHATDALEMNRSSRISRGRHSGMERMAMVQATSGREGMATEASSSLGISISLRSMITIMTCTNAPPRSPSSDHSTAEAPDSPKVSSPSAKYEIAAVRSDASCRNMSDMAESALKPTSTIRAMPAEPQ